LSVQRIHQNVFLSAHEGFLPSPLSLQDVIIMLVSGWCCKDRGVDFCVSSGIPNQHIDHKQTCAKPSQKNKIKNEHQLNQNTAVFDRHVRTN
jgi:hypothetical protein